MSAEKRNEERNTIPTLLCNDRVLEQEDGLHPMGRLTHRSRAEANDSLFFAFFQTRAHAGPALGRWFARDRPYLREGDVAVSDEAHRDVRRDWIAGGSEERVKVEHERVDFCAHQRNRGERKLGRKLELAGRDGLEMEILRDGL